MSVRRAIAVIGALLFMGAGVVATAGPSAADQIWYQGIGRANAAAACPQTSAADGAAGWSAWTPSWAEWANGGKGGYVCTRSVTWAHESNVASDEGVCAEWTAGLYLYFGTRVTLSGGTQLYSTPDCSALSNSVTGQIAALGRSQAEAQARCDVVGPGSVATQIYGIVGPNTWACRWL